MLRRERKGLNLFDNMMIYHIMKQIGGVCFVIAFPWDR